ncbi:MAG: Nif3-like dinuclear metal center hexameric protein [Deltaproteobacteria bacterium]|nr:Nif3-like dinuclear metal center hexameric protein [Deltaproteobacteria bacterium]
MVVVVAVAVVADAHPAVPDVDFQRMVDSTEVPRVELVSYLDDLLDAHTGVSACRELFQGARQKGADTVLVHHGIFWRGDPPVLTGFRRQRVAELFAGNLNLIAYHLPLDRHAQLGNNALAVRQLGLEEIQPFGLYEGAPIGARGRFPEPVTPADLAERCGAVFGQQPLMFADGVQSISTVGMISGAAQREFYRAIDTGLDAFITGESSEWVVNIARETGVAYLAAGHYATETLGVRALGDHIADRFGIDIDFIDVPNPV